MAKQTATTLTALAVAKNGALHVSWVMYRKVEWSCSNKSTCHRATRESTHTARTARTGDIRQR